MSNRPQPVLNSNLVASGVLVLCYGLAAVGVQVSDVDQKALVDGIGAVIGLVGVVAHLVAAFRARQKVTPLAAPQNAAGTELVAAVEDGDPHEYHGRHEAGGNVNVVP